MTQSEIRQENLAKSIVAQPLLDLVHADNDEKFQVIIELNLDFTDGRTEARKQISLKLRKLKAIEVKFGAASHPFVFAEMSGASVLKLARDVMELKDLKARPIYRIWLDHEVSGLLTESVRTVKADAARVSFAAEGQSIVWAVIDSGVDGTHRHFDTHNNLELKAPLQHFDFSNSAENHELGRCDGETLEEKKVNRAKLVDELGHGTHVAGIIAGEITYPDPDGRPVKQVLASQSLVPTASDTKSGEEKTRVECNTNYIKCDIRGVAPRTNILSIRVLDKNGSGRTSRIIAGIEKILELNDYGRRILIHGVNLSVGYWFDPEWFACGQSPLCVAVDRLVRSGVVVVVAAGNSGYVQTNVFRSTSNVNKAGQMVSINDPGNAPLAITVGSTHRNMPHTYGVSYFSSKGPTGDGRRKPDLVAPGEKIISCGARNSVMLEGALAKVKVEDGSSNKSDSDTAYYLEYSGTSMAAPHVSGAIAALLSIRPEFIGQTDRIKNIFTSTATDLDRNPNFQGAGMVDLMRAIQSI